MSRKFDAEDLLDSVLAMMTDGGALNAKIAAVEAEKTTAGKQIGLEAIASDAYYRQTWNDKILNHVAAIYYGIENNQTIGTPGATAIQYSVFVEIIMADSGNDSNIVNRILRYTRAIQELFEEKFGAVAEFGKIKVETVRPISFKLENDTSDDVKAGGVSITMTLA